MPIRGFAVLTLALMFGVVGGACRKQPSEVEGPEEAPLQGAAATQIDAPAICTAACERLESCVPELAGDIDEDPAVVAERLANECAPACQGFADPVSAAAVDDCTSLNSCAAFWGCVSTAEARPWLATVAPVGERTCENLCGQASACAVAKVCESEAESEDGGRRTRPGKASGDDSDTAANPSKADETTPADVDDECSNEAALRDELDERCLLQCRALPEASRTRAELIGCVDHLSCDGLLGCLDGWAATDYEPETGPTPGISTTCDAFCTRAIVCGAEDSGVELEPDALAELKQAMTSSYVECAVQCEKDLETGGEPARAKFDECLAVETCHDFDWCSDDV